MSRSVAKISKDVQRTFDKCLALELEIQQAHADGDWDRAWQAALKLRPAVRKSGHLVEDFCKAVKRET